MTTERPATEETIDVPIVSIVFGLLLLGVGAYGVTHGFDYGYKEAIEKFEPKNITSLIPAALGVLLIVSGVVGLVERLLKHAMHAAAVVGVLGVILAAVGFGMGVARNGFNIHNVSTKAVLVMAGLCVVFVGLCVNSFVQARRRRAAGRP